MSAALVALLVGLGGCDLTSELEPHPDEITLSQIIQLSRTGGDLPIPANGTAGDTLVAKIPRGASARVVTFTTSRGSFQLNPGDKTIKVRAERTTDPHDQRLVARAVLVSDTVAGQAVVSASVSDFTDYLVVPFVR